MVLPRATAHVITDAGAFECAWLEVAPRLRSYLRSRGAEPYDADDLVQECAERVLSSAVTYSSADDLLRWCYVVARNLQADLRRKQAWFLPAFDADAPAETDVHRCVAAKLDLSAVLKAWPSLSAADRHAILGVLQRETAPTPARGEAVRLNVARHRARQRLHALLAGSLGVVWGCGRMLRNRFLPTTPAATFALSACVLILPAPFAPSDTPREQAVGAAMQGAADEAGDERSAEAGTQPSVPRAVRVARSRHVGDTLHPVVSVLGPSGDGATVSSHAPEEPGQIRVCVGGLPVLEPICVGRQAPVGSLHLADVDAEPAEAP